MNGVQNTRWPQPHYIDGISAFELVTHCGPQIELISVAYWAHGPVHEIVHLPDPRLPRAQLSSLAPWCRHPVSAGTRMKLLAQHTIS
jgi:hypothetical protein